MLRKFSGGIGSASSRLQRYRVSKAEEKTSKVSRGLGSPRHDVGVHGDVAECGLEWVEVVRPIAPVCKHVETWVQLRASHLIKP